MEAASCVKDICSHAALLLAGLNLQREEAELCDCVVRQRQNPAQLYPAHKCVLAASSPVLAAILSSTGALVELQAPCLSDSVLELLLDYIYTGALPYMCSQDQYYSLLTAACHLEMDKLQEALLHWKQTGANVANKTNASIGAESASCGISEGPASTISYNTCIQESTLIHQERERGQKAKEGELERTVEERQSLFLPATAESQAERIRAKRMRFKTRQEQTNKREQDVIQNHQSPPLLSTSLPPVCTSRMDTGSPSQCSSLPSSSSLCCGAVPVICHSSRAALLQQPEGSHPADYPSSRSASMDNDSIVDVTTKHQNNYREQNWDYRKNKDHLRLQSWDYEGCIDHGPKRDSCYKSNTEQDYNSSKANDFIEDNQEYVGNGLSHVTDNNAHCDSEGNHPRLDSVLRKRNCSNFNRGIKYETQLSFEDFSSKYHPLESSDRQDLSVTTEKEKSIQSKDTRTLVSLPLDDSSTGNDPHFEDLCPKTRAKEEHSYSCRSADEMDGEDNHHGPKKTNSNKSKRRTTDVADAQHEKDNRYTGYTRGADVCPPVSTTPKSSLHNITGRLSTSELCTPLDFGQVLNIEITEPHVTYAKATDSVISDPADCTEVPSYCGHLHYHYLSEKDTYYTNRESNLGKSVDSSPDHSDQSHDEDEVGIITSSGCTQHFTTETANQVLLLDISTKPGELLVSYKNRGEEGERGVAFGKKNTNGRGVRDRELQSEAILVTSVAKRNSSAKCVAATLAKASVWVEEQEVKERYSVTAGKDRSRLGAKVKHRVGSLEEEGIPNSRGGESQNSSLTVCTPPRVPDNVQSSMSSTLSIPSTLSPSMPLNSSAHLSTSAHHPFQCSLCDRAFSQRGSLNRHVRSHLGVRPFPCPRCPMTFSRQYRVTEHMRVHERSALGSDFQKPPASSI